MFVAVTGAQGVGKSTFCEKLRSLTAESISEPVVLLAGLGEQIRSQGLIVGTNANDEAVAAIYAAHLFRERTAPKGIVILDRCAVDASAYVRALTSLPEAHRKMYNEISWLMSRRLSYVVHLKMTGIFEPIKVHHETEDFRKAVAREIPLIIEEYNLHADELYAADEPSLNVAVKKIVEAFQQPL
ncbi:MAG: AAA family ATPase [Proteobacteria bacterium]|nr:AAA family ATPase [Pseudomonadota bacterium]